MNPSLYRIVRPLHTNFENASAETLALGQLLKELQLTRRKLADVVTNNSELLAQIEILEHNGSQ